MTDYENRENIRLLKEILSVLKGILIVEEAILREVRVPQVNDFHLRQLKGGKPMPITGVAAGATGTFQISLVPPTGVPLQSGPVVAVDDSLVTITQPDSTLTFTAAVAASDTGTSFNLTITGVNGAGTPLSHVFNVPILPAPPVQVTDFGLDQLS